MNEVRSVVDRQLKAYNGKNFLDFSACYHKDVISIDLQTSTVQREMCGQAFFNYYEKKFLWNPDLYCQVVNRIIHGNLVVDEELISGYSNCEEHKECVIYQVDDGLITKMWFSREISLKDCVFK